VFSRNLWYQETSSFIGPFVTSAIVDAAGGNTYAAFYFLLPLGLIALGVVCCISPAKAKIDVARCKFPHLWVLMVDLEKEARTLYGQQERPSEKELEVVQDVRQWFKCLGLSKKSTEWDVICYGL
jgi:hypothetical protein